MRKLSSWAVLLPLCSAASVAAETHINNTAAAENSDTLLELEFEPMTVTVNRFEQPVSSVLAPITVIKREEIEATQAKSVADILKFMPGIEVSSNGGKGQATAISVRGTEGDHVLVLLDGVRISSATLGAADIGLIPTSMIERIEYIRGPRAAIYGSDAIGGVISLITKPDEKAALYELMAGVGGDNYAQAAWRSYSKISENTQFQFNYNHEKSDGYSVKPTTTDKHGYKSQVMLAGLEHQFGDYVFFDFKGLKNSGYVDYDSYGTTTRSYRDNWQVASNLLIEIDDFISQLQVSRNRSDSEGIAKGTAGPGNRFNTLRDMASWINTVSVADSATVNLGADWLKDDVSASTSAYSVSSRTNKAIFTTAHGYIGPVTLEGSGRSDDNEQYGRHNTWNLALGWQIIDSLKLMMSHGTAFKAPTFNDLYYPAMGNPSLEPETSRASELNLRGQHLLLSWQLSAYQNDIDNLIDWAPTGEVDTDGWDIYKPNNVNEAQIKGVELELSFDTGLVSHGLVAEYIEPKDTATDKLLVNRAKQKYKWQARLAHESWELGLDYLYRGERYSDAANTHQLGGYSLWECSASYHITNALVLRGRVENLFNKQYEAKKGYNSQDRIAYLNASYQF